MTLLGAETRTRLDYRGFHYHRERNHQGLDNQLLHRPPPSVSPWTPTLSGGNAWADFSVSTIEEPHERSAH